MRMTHQWYVGLGMWLWVVVGLGDAFEWGVEVIADPLVSKIWRLGE